MNTTKIVELVIDEDSQELAIDAISLVSAPAIEENWVFFGKEKNNLTLAKVDEDKRMLVSPALIPDKQIFRYDPNTDSEYYVYFSKDTVRKASELYLKNNNHHKATEEHSERVSGVLTVESWIIEDTKTDKSTLYGFSLPKGTWMVKMKIENEDLWQKIKSGELKGLSIEGYFTNKFEQMNKKQPTREQILSALNEMIKSKTELKAEKIELSSIKELEKQIKGMKGALKYVDDRIDEGDKYIKELVKYRNFSLDVYSKLIKLKPKMQEVAQEKLNNFEKAAKELGVSVNSVPQVKEIKQLITDTESQMKRTKTLIKRFEQQGLK